MKMLKILSGNHLRANAAVMCMALLASGCADDNSAQLQPAPRLNSKVQANVNNHSNSSSVAGDYSIQLTVVGNRWTYTITKNAGAKDLSHFILNFQNCQATSATINNIVWATVNGNPAILSASEGNTGCDVKTTTTNFVKFDNLPDASTYTIVFELNRIFGNFVGTTAWLKAGNSCITYPVLAPCCPL